MRPIVVIGILLMLAGGYVLVRGVTYTADRSVLQLGEFEASFEERRAVPTWLGVVAVAGGAALVGSGFRRRRPERPF